ncbi:hypothetical protein, partial [Salmonella enterica]|uniref:hypothetical protein n=1 Tax=Salmonella enterica TaxID=28901 RepID=UPI0019805B84
TGSFGPYGCPENLSVRFFPNSAGSPDRHYGRRSSTIASSILATLFSAQNSKGLRPLFAKYII